jgi:hypothetical protein
VATEEDIKITPGTTSLVGRPPRVVALYSSSFGALTPLRGRRGRMEGERERGEGGRKRGMEREEESERTEKICKTELRCAPRHIFAIYMIFFVRPCSMSPHKELREGALPMES